MSEPVPAQTAPSAATPPPAALRPADRRLMDAARVLPDERLDPVIVYRDPARLVVEMVHPARVWEKHQTVLWAPSPEVLCVACSCQEGYEPAVCPHALAGVTQVPDPSIK